MPILASEASLCEKKSGEQECIPVGCVPPTHLPYLRISSYPTHAPLGAAMHTPQSNHTCPPWSNHTPPGSNHACPPPQSNHACPPGATMHAPQSNHACFPPEQPRTPQATMHAPLWTECGQTLLKILPCPNFIAGGKKWYPQWE